MSDTQNENNQNHKELTHSWGGYGLVVRCTCGWVSRQSSDNDGLVETWREHISNELSTNVVELSAGQWISHVRDGGGVQYENLNTGEIVIAPKCSVVIGSKSAE